MWEGQFTTFWQIPDKKNYNYAITTYWQIPDKYNNYNYVRGQLTTFWQIPDKKNNYNYARGQFTTFWQIPDKKIITIMWEAIYYLLTDSRQKNNYNYVRGQFTTFWQIPDKKIITIMWKGNLLPFDRFQTKKIITICEMAIYYIDRFQTKKITITIMTDETKKLITIGQFTTFWQIPEKKLQLCERANYYLLTDSRQI